MSTRRQFLKQGLGASAAFLGSDAVAAQAKRPNIILILADDLGYSDIRPYGSEIETSNLDRLAKEGLRFSQFYNSPRRAFAQLSAYRHVFASSADGRHGL